MVNCLISIKYKLRVKLSITQKAVLVIIGVLTMDQVLKFIIKTRMLLYEDIHVIGNWFILKFIENDGMAFGLDIPGDYGKLFLTLFRLLAAVAIIFYMRHLIREGYHNGLILSISLIFAGAVGNIIDSVFYGMIFSESTVVTTAEFLPEGGGYGTFLHGHVVDMFYFPIMRGTWPEWIPFKGGHDFEFFRPVFNIADSAITVGVFTILIFQKRFFHQPEEEIKAEETGEGFKTGEGENPVQAS